MCTKEPRAVQCKPTCVSSVMLQQNNLQEAQWCRAAVLAWWWQTSLSCFPPSLSLSLTGYMPEFWGPACNWSSEGHGFLYSRRRGSALHLPGNKVSLGIHSSQKPRSLHTLTSRAVLSCVLVGRTVPQEDLKSTFTSSIWEFESLHAKPGDNPFSQTHFKKISWDRNE